MNHPIAVANYFIKKSLETGELITLMKLIKLVYISHGWHLGLSGEPLITEGVQAWKYGPVIKSVYNTFMGYGREPITEVYSFYMDDTHIVPMVEDSRTTAFLDRIWDVYHGFTALQLSSMTHRDGSPWYTTWHERGGSTNMDVFIPNNIIRDYYVRQSQRA